MLDVDIFLNIPLNNPTLSIDEQIDHGKLREVMENRKNIVPITYILLEKFPHAQIPQ